MATVLEELLVKIGFQVDAKGLKDAQRSIIKEIDGLKPVNVSPSGKTPSVKIPEARKEIVVEKERNEVEQQRVDIWKQTGDQLDRNKSKEKERKRDEEEYVDRGKMINKELSAAKGLLGKVAGGWVAVGAAAGAYVYKTAQFDDANMKVARSLGISAEELEKFQVLAKLGGTTSESMAGNIQGLTRAIGGADMLGEFNQGFALMDISTRKANGELKTGIDVLKEMADAIEGFPEAEQLTMITLAGVSADLLPALQQGRYRISEALNTIEADADDTKVAMEDLNDSFVKLGVTLKNESEPLRKFGAAFATAFARTAEAVVKTPGQIGDVFTGGMGRKDAEVLKATKEKQLSALMGSGFRPITNNITVNANGLNEDQAKRVATEAMTNALRTSRENNDQRGEL